MCKLILVFIFVISSCDLGRIAFMRNHSVEPIELIVFNRTENVARDADTIRYKNNIITDIKMKTFYDLDSVILAHKKTNLVNSFQIPGKSTTCIGAPIYGFDKNHNKYDKQFRYIILYGQE